jgi:hypothetical protein
VLSGLLLFTLVRDFLQEVYRLAIAPPLPILSIAQNS